MGYSGGYYCYDSCVAIGIPGLGHSASNRNGIRVWVQILDVFLLTMLLDVIGA